MPCVPVPSVTLPTLPAPWSLAPPSLPGIVTPGLCCNLVPPVALTPRIPLGALVITPAVILLINQGLHVVQAYIDALDPGCPRAA